MIIFFSFKFKYIKKIVKKLFKLSIFKRIFFPLIEATDRTRK